MIGMVLTDLVHGFEVALHPIDFPACFVGILLGNIVGVLPGMDVMAAISILLPLFGAIVAAPKVAEASIEADRRGAIAG